MKKDKVSVYVEGNIGGGKSSLLGRIPEGRVRSVNLEPVGEWQALLELLYEEPSKWSFQMALQALVSFLKVYNAHEKEDSDVTSDDEKSLKVVRVYERSPLSSRLVFNPVHLAMQTMDETSIALLKEITDLTSPPLPDVVVYIRTDPCLCHQRVKSRARPGEASISAEYIHKIHEQHDKVYIRREGADVAELLGSTKIFVIDGNRQVDDVYAEFDKILASLV